MTPREFIRKWKPVALSEKSVAQSHFRDLCELVEHGDPVSLDPTGESFTFEKGVPKTGGGDGFADVWKKEHFAWEYKKRRRSLDEALKQLTQYASALENPPLHVACDTDRIKIVTAWTNTVPKSWEIELEDLADPEKFKILHAVFHDPESLRPKLTRQTLTQEAADKFSTIAFRLQGADMPENVAHFVNQLVFCFFANSVKLLPEGLFAKLLNRASARPERAKGMFDKLFAAMEEGGELDFTDISHFNGGLFDGRRALPLDEGSVGLLKAAASLDWAQIDPTIFGTLFERFLDPDKRAQIGAHYTDAEKIMLLVEPVILRPLRREWAEAKEKIAAIMNPVMEGERAETGRGAERAFNARVRRAMAEAEKIRMPFLERLRRARILDPACGSGNFLYLALQGVKDLELLAIHESEELGLDPQKPEVGPEILFGIELNPLAAELARTTIWIGDIQWGLRNGFYTRPEPILRKLDNIECRDALIAWDAALKEYAEAAWPEAEFIVGNPPFLGGKLLRTHLGGDVVGRLFKAFDERVPPEADLVIYWFRKALDEIKAGRARRCGLVATNSIRGGANRKLLEEIARDSAIFEAWSDEPWVLDGAAVRVSLVCFGQTGDNNALRLNGADVLVINVDLTSQAADLTQAKAQIENAGLGSNGITKKGAFETTGSVARAWLTEPLNVNGRPNADVIWPWVNGVALMRERGADKWIIDFTELNRRNASFYSSPFSHVVEKVKPFRDRSNSKSERENWWRIARPASLFRTSIRGMRRYIATAEVSKHRVFAWLDFRILPDKNLVVFARDDDITFGILHSHFHVAWSLRLGTSLEDRPRYTSTTTFETFPFPDGLTPNIPARNYARDPRARRIAAAAKALDDRRNAWLNPPDLVETLPEVTPTASPGEAPRKYPDRVVPKDARAAILLKERTLTNLYNERPAWLAALHDDLDRAVAAAYGWPEEISTDDALAKLLELNLARAAKEP